MQSQSDFCVNNLWLQHNQPRKNIDITQQITTVYRNNNMTLFMDHFYSLLRNGSGQFFSQKNKTKEVNINKEQVIKTAFVEHWLQFLERSMFGCVVRAKRGGIMWCASLTQISFITFIILIFSHCSRFTVFSFFWCRIMMPLSHQWLQTHWKQSDMYLIQYRTWKWNKSDFRGDEKIRTGLFRQSWKSRGKKRWIESHFPAVRTFCSS